MRGWLAAPLTSADGVNLGLIQVSDKRLGDFDDDDENALVQLAHIAAVAIENARLYDQLRQREQRLAALAADRQRIVADALDAEDRMRRRIAQFLHDEVVQELLAARQDIAQAARQAPDARHLLERAETGLDRSVGSLRRVSSDLHPIVLDHGGLEAAVRSVAEHQAERGGFVISLEVATDAAGREQLVLSILRELLANVVKHADTHHVRVRLWREGDRDVLEVRDDGRGMDERSMDEAVQRGHIGLASIAQRVEALGGRLEVAAAPTGGTRVRATLPTA